MKGLNQIELELLCDEIQTWVGSQLQEIVASENQIALGFYHERQVQWMLFDFATQSPVFILLPGQYVRRLNKQTKPLTLFLRAHFEGKRISKIELGKDQGRVLKIFFHSEANASETNSLYLEVILFSFAKNFLAISGDKKIHFFKPKEVALQNQNSTTKAELSARSFHAIEREWLIEKGFLQDENLKLQPTDIDAKLNKLILKKSVALEKMRADILEKTSNRWSEAGEWLKLHQNLKAPTEFTKLIDAEKSLSQNILFCFSNAKEQERKLSVAKLRAEELHFEIEKLKKSLDQADHLRRPQAQPPIKKSFLQKLGAQARTLKLDENLQAFIGKSAKDNLDILRRAQAFDFWMHLRDTPSAHVVIRRTRDRQVSELEFRKIAQWLIAENFGKKAKEKAGESFDLIICECRFVKPIKGDKLGRVHFQNDHTLRIKFDPNMH